MGRAGTPKMPSKDIAFDNMRVFQKLITPDVIDTLKDHYKVEIVHRVEKTKKPEKNKNKEDNTAPAKKQTAFIEVFARTVDKADEVIDVIKSLRKRIDRYERAAAKTYTKNQNTPKISDIKPDPVYISVDQAAEVQEIIRPYLNPLSNKQQSGKKLFSDEKSLHTALSGLSKKFAVKSDTEFPVQSVKNHINNRLMNVDYQTVVSKVNENIGSYEQRKIHEAKQYQKQVFSAFTSEESNHFVNDVRDAVEAKARRAAKKTSPALSDDQIDNMATLSSEQKQNLSWMVLRNIYETQLSKEEVKAVAQQHRPQNSPTAAVAEDVEDNRPAWMRVGFSVGKVTIAAKNERQAEYIDAIANKDLVIGIGAAGTGKTYLATAMAAKMLDTAQVKKIYLVRPATEAGENLGFLPGDIGEKLAPFMRPYYDTLEEIWGSEKLKKNMELGKVEIAPLAYMRGRTIKDAAFLLDESQNTTRMQMKMFLTRLGDDVKVIINGDHTQDDLNAGRKKSMTGLDYAVAIVKKVPDTHITYYKEEDSVRSKMTRNILLAMREFDESERDIAIKQTTREPVDLGMLQDNAANMNGQDQPKLVVSSNGNGLTHN
jgi:phosphate starvation-inducible protein PhoH